MSRFVCVHGHFYQPPRENPWLEAIEVQDSAYPFHDWNERVAAECYAPNTASRILDSEGLVSRIVNNYSRISFNFGPTLLSWMESEMPRIHQAVLAADKESMDRFSGHGAAIAQAYNHMIMPLANRRDKQTQILWGIRDFEHRFRREPEGMWLPETAVDTETLDLLSEYGIRFTILAPRQAARVRKLGDKNWHETPEESVDPRRPYLQRLPSGREITLFFYDGAISREVAFNGLLEEGKRFASRLESAFDGRSNSNQLVHIATDGETYGHHHRFGDMAIAAALDIIEGSGHSKLSIYGEYLDNQPAQWEAQIVENSSWSCVHGVERWRSNCGCNTGGRQHWNQQWRGPLRAAFDWLRDDLDEKYAETASELFVDPWTARDAYIDVVLDRSEETVVQFLSAHSRDGVPEGDSAVRALKLLELQRHLMLIYTSCGWFFDELSGIETVQVVQYSGRVLQLASALFDSDEKKQFLTKLADAKSNIPEYGDGRTIFETWVEPGIIGLQEFAAHFAISLLFSWNGRTLDASLTAHGVQVQDYELREIGGARFATGVLRIESLVTLESAELQFAALHLGDHNVTCGVSRYSTSEEFSEWAAGFLEAADSGDILALLRVFDSVFDSGQYTLRSLFRDEQRRILELVLQSATERAEGVYQTLYEQQLPVMRFLVDIGSPIPQALRTAAEYFMNSIIRRALERAEGPVDHVWLKQRLDQTRELHIKLDSRGLGLLLERDIRRMLEEFRTGSPGVEELERLEAAVDLAHHGELSVDLWDAQNMVYEIAHREYADAIAAARSGDEQKSDWADLFKSLASHVSVRLPSD